MSETGKTFEKVRNTLQPLVAKSWTEGVALANSVPENVAKSLTETVTNSAPGNIAKSMAESVAKCVTESVAKCVTESVAKSFPDSSTVRKPKELLEVRQINSPVICSNLRCRRINTVTHTNTSLCPAQLAFESSE
jgi:hypothetical protein